MRVRDLMTPSPATCREDTPLNEVAKMMRDNDCGAIPVMTNDEAVGVVTDRDITIRIVAEGHDPRERTAGDAMTSPVISVSPDEDVERAIQKMEDRRIRRIVVSDNGSVQGIVAQADIALQRPGRETGEMVEEVSVSGNAVPR